MGPRQLRVTTLGAATADVFLSGAALSAKCDPKRGCYEEFALGEKLELEQVTFATGGGATNAAVTFARQGFDTTVLAKVGDDYAGRDIMRSLRAEGIHASRLAVDIHDSTGYATILLAPGGERSILVYRGVSEKLKFKDFDFNTLKADWLYISSLAGNLELLEKVLGWAKTKNVKVALDPGSRELARAPQLRKLLGGVTMIKGNKGELAKLFDSDDAKTVLARANKTCQYAIVSDGKNGSWASDSVSVVHAGMYSNSKVVDRTGAGDAFGSGFVAMIALGKDLRTAASFASANATGVVGHIGAKAGILHQNAQIQQMPIKVSKASKA